MKNPIVIITTMFLLLIGTTQIKAQDYNPRKNNYLILSQNIQQLKPVILASNELVKEDGKKYGDFYIIICGKTVSDIPNNVEFYELLEQAKVGSVTIFVCGLSLKKFNIDSHLLPRNITVVDNGILYAFQLMKKGFKTLTI
jgi:intracellular sulfur oxidation DsrE/DsrF family protein